MKNTILYVDDEPENQSGFQLVFRKKYEVFTASSGEEGLELLHHFTENGRTVELVIADQRMPEMTGVQFLEQVRVISPDSIRMILTGYSDAEAMMQAINIGQVYRYITKPWKKDEMGIILDNALETYRLRIANQLLIRDLQEKNKALQQSEEKFSKAFYVSPMAICMVRQMDNIIVDCNQNFVNLAGQDREYLINQHFDTLSCWPVGSEQERLINCLQHEGRLVNFEHEFKGQNDEKRYVRTSTELVQINDQEHILLLFNDITEQKNADERVLKASLEIEDRERERIAGEIHDSLGQNLTVASLNFEMSGRVFSEQKDEKHYIMHMKGREYLDMAIRESRSLAHHLMPSLVKDFGYVAAVESLIDGMASWKSSEVNFYHNLGDERMPASLEYHFYRITQEAINNALKHAEASSITLQVMLHDDSIILTCEDNGKGFEPSLHQKSFGLNSMRSRAKSVKGKFMLDSAQGRGTTITIQVPLTAESKLLNDYYALE